jgi:hypothetical protein
MMHHMNVLRFLQTGGGRSSVMVQLKLIETKMASRQFPTGLTGHLLWCLTLSATHAETESSLYAVLVMYSSDFPDFLRVTTILGVIDGKLKIRQANDVGHANNVLKRPIISSVFGKLRFISCIVNVFNQNANLTLKKNAGNRGFVSIACMANNFIA